MFFYKGKRIFGLILLCLGAGMVLSMILPFWCLLAITGAALMCAGWCWWRK